MPDGSAHKPLRILDTESGKVTLVADRAATHARTGTILAAVAIATLAFLGSTPFIDSAWIPWTFGVVLAWTLAATLQSAVVNQRIELTATGIRVRPQTNRSPGGVVPLSAIESGNDSVGLFTRRGGDRHVPWDDVADLLRDDISITLVLDDGTRETLPLEGLSPADIGRLYDEMRGPWERARGGVADSEDAAERRRSAVRALAGQGAGTR